MLEESLKSRRFGAYTMRLRLQPLMRRRKSGRCDPTGEIVAFTDRLYEFTFDQLVLRNRAVAH